MNTAAPRAGVGRSDPWPADRKARPARAARAARAARPASPAGPDTVAWLLFISGLTLSFVLSAQALDALGIPYDAPYGPMVAKLHPGSYLLAAAWVFGLARHGNPLIVALASARQQPLLSTYLGCMVLVFVWVVVRHGTSGAAYIIQTLWMPGLALLTLTLLARRRRRQTLAWLMVLLCANALLALAEYFGHFHFVPLPAEQEGLLFRASAFLGHPLANANITVALLPALALVPWRPALRVAAIAVVLAAMLAFGGRTALGVGLAVYGLQLLLTVSLRALSGRYSYLQLTGGGAGLLLGGVALGAALLASGLGARIFNNLTWDNSADVRLRAWEAFDHLRGADWWLGLSPVQIEHVSLAMGLDPRYEAIENFWVGTYLQFGLIGFLPFVAGLAALVLLMLVRGAPMLRSAVLVFFVVASAANTLSSKTVSLTLVSVLLLASTPQRRRRRAATPSATAWAHTMPLPLALPARRPRPTAVPMRRPAAGRRATS